MLQISPKVSRSAARHLRRKKLVAARKKTGSLELSYFEGINDPEIISEKKHSPINTCSVSAIGISIKPSKIILDNGEKCNVSTNVDIVTNHKNIDASQSCHKSKEYDVLKVNKIQDKKKPKTSEQKNISFVATGISTNSESVYINCNPQDKMDIKEKPKTDVDAERKAKKAAKAAAKSKAKEKIKTENVSYDQVDDANVHKVMEKSNITSKNIQSSLSDMSISKAQTESKNPEVVDKKKSEDQIMHPKGCNESTSKTEEKSKAALKAERRAKQEAQRAAKIADKSKLVKSVPDKKQQMKPAESAPPKEVMKKIVTKLETKEHAHEVKLFKHLYINRKNISEVVNCNNVKLHPAILRLGVQYAEKVIVGSNARCVALLAAIKQLINDFERPSQADFTRGLEASLQESVNYLNFCRTSAVSMQNALKHLKWQMSTLTTTISDEEVHTFVIRQSGCFTFIFLIIE